MARAIPKWMFDSSVVKSSYMSWTFQGFRPESKYARFGFTPKGYFIAEEHIFLGDMIWMHDYFEDWPNRTPEEDLLFELEIGHQITFILEEIANVR